MSRIAVFLLVLCLPLQVLSAPGRHLTHTADRMVEHMVEHALHVPHHHDEGGTIHHGGGEQSLGHQLDFDCSTSLSAALPDVVKPSVSGQSQTEPVFLASVPPDRFFDLPHPPPRPAP
ncbi:hypothetical protein [Cupriavidus taiwanensis]|uniref:hypothetical protein n=1 Tax=Cupriavidus taiwanensis TaxID=164546 RepID=UPI000E17B36D|nr:hypothetical protein [Cupriavidus taiwanensis]SOY44505.1 conserved exported hypothetical protein [Cupriavidus taiwanensis]